MAEPERDAAVVRLLNDMETLRRSLRLYPSSHPALKPARTRIRERAEAAAGGRDSAVLSFGPGTAFWDGRELALPANAPASRLIALLFQAGVAAVNLRFPDACVGLAELVGLLSEVHDPPGQADRERLFSGAAALGGLELVAIDLSDVRVLPSEEEPVRPGTRPVWAELARRLSRDGSFPLAGKVREGELTPGMVLEMAAEGRELDLLFDHLFLQLGEIVRASPVDRRPVTLQEVREFFDELVFLLTPERRRLAVVAAVRHLPVVGGDDPWVAAELVLDAVEFMVLQEVAVPDTVQRALVALAAPPAGSAVPVPPEVAERARHLLARVPVGELEDVTANVIPSVPFSADWSAEPHARELAEELSEARVTGSLLRLLEEVVGTWPGQPVARRATVRLAEALASAVEVGDLAAATRLAPLVTGSPEPEAAQVVADSVVPAAARAFKALDRARHPELANLLAALGDGALPAILNALAEEESLAVRRRLLEVVTGQGARAVPHLLPLLDDGRWYVVRNAAYLLRTIGAREAAPALRAHAPRAHPKVLAEVLRALAAFDDPEWLRLLVAGLDSPAPETRTVAAEVAGSVSHPEVVRVLVERLRPCIGNGLKEPFAVALIRALGRQRDPAALAPLQQVLALKQWRYPFSLDPARREAGVAIARLSGAAARRQALALAEDRDAGLAAAVKAALSRKAEPEDDA